LFREISKIFGFEGYVFRRRLLWIILIESYEKLDHFHFGPLFGGDDAGFVQ
jgi:hypothetical protein